MARWVFRLAILGLFLFPFQLSYGTPDGFIWKADFNPASSPDLRALHEALYGSDVERLEARRISDLAWIETDFVLHIRSGILYLEPEIEGVSAGAYFEGEATISFGPSKSFATEHLTRYLGRPTIFKLPVETFYIFSLRDDSPLRAARASPPPKDVRTPADAGTYVKDKTILRKLGFNLTWSFLNRSSHAEGATYVLFPMEEIRTERSEEARLLYADHPMMGVTMAVFGHDEIATHSPYKFNFASLATYEVTPLRSGIIDVDRYAIQVSLTNDTGRAEQRATIALTPEAGLGALRLQLTTQMQVSGVTDSNGNQIPFLQWAHLKNDPNFDQTVVVALPYSDAPQDEEGRSITIESKGIIFDSRFSAESKRVTQLQDEDHWYPRPFPLNESDDAHFEIDLTYPKRLVAIGPGERVLEEVEGRRRRVVFRTIHPRDDTTFYFGEYGKTDVVTDEFDVEYYYFKLDHTARGKAKRVAKEVARAVEYFSQELGPLDLTTWRATEFGSPNRRFLEGLVYRAVGKGHGTYDDFFQSHRVAHQWWGTCVSASHRPEDLWLEEALAYYSAMEYFESTYDDPRKMWDILYLHMFRPLAEGYIQREDLTGQEERILGRSTQPLIKGTRNIYVKGPMVLRMLDYLFRVEKGKALMEVLRDYLEPHRYQTICMDDFQAAVEVALGLDLDWFFNQWVREGGIPVVAWRHLVRHEKNVWIVRLDADQRVGQYRLLVPVYLHYPGGKVTVHPWNIDGESSTMTVRVPDKPSKVTLNDNLESLVVLKVQL
jgi:hypothetical protein